jgi:hypothetical protein
MPKKKDPTSLPTEIQQILRLPIEQRAIICNSMKFSHAALLLHFSPAKNLEFWEQNQLTINGKQLSALETVEYVWNPKHTVPLTYFTAIPSKMNAFCLANGIDLYDVFYTAIKFVNGSVTPPTFMVWALGGIFQTSNHSKDIRLEILKKLKELNDASMPGTLQCLAKLEIEQTCIKATMVGSWTRDGKDHLLPHMDSEITAALPGKLFPIRIGYPEHESYIMIGDTETIKEKTFSGHTVATQDTQVLLDGQVIGTCMQFPTYISRLGLDLTTIPIPDITVTIATSDWQCPIRKRTVIHKGCAYGAPYAIVTLVLKPIEKNRNTFSQLFNEVWHHETSPWAILQKNMKSFAVHRRKKAYLYITRQKRLFFTIINHFFQACKPRYLRICSTPISKRRERIFATKSLPKTTDLSSIRKTPVFQPISSASNRN